MDGGTAEPAAGQLAEPAAGHPAEAAAPAARATRPSTRAKRPSTTVPASRDERVSASRDVGSASGEQPAGLLGTVLQQVGGRACQPDTIGAADDGGTFGVSFGHTTHHVLVNVSCTPPLALCACPRPRPSRRHAVTPSRHHAITPPRCHAVTLSRCHTSAPHHAITPSRRPSCCHANWHHAIHHVITSRHHVIMSSYQLIIKSSHHHAVTPFTHIHHVITSLCRHAITPSRHHAISPSRHHTITSPARAHPPRQRAKL